MRTLMLFLVLIGGSLDGRAEPISEITIRGYFYASGKTRIEIELEPDLIEHPKAHSSFTFSDLQQLNLEEKQGLQDQAIDFISDRFDLVFEPSRGVGYPKFAVSFTNAEGKELESSDELVVLLAIWETFLPESVETYQLKVKNTGGLSVASVNYVNNQLVNEGSPLVKSEDGSVLLALPERISEQEIRSLMIRPLLFGVGVLLVFLLLRFLRR